MFDFFSTLAGKGLLGGSVGPELMGLQQGAQAAGPGMTFGGTPGPIMSAIAEKHPFLSKVGPNQAQPAAGGMSFKGTPGPIMSALAEKHPFLSQVGPRQSAGPAFSGFPGQPNVDPFMAQMGPQPPMPGSMPDVMNPQGAVTYPAGLASTMRGGQPNFFPNMPQNLGLGNAPPDLSQQFENLPPMMRRERERQQMQALPSGGVHRMNPLAPQRFGQMAKMMRRGR